VTSHGQKYEVLLKNKYNTKKVWGMTQLIDHKPSKCEVSSSNPSAAKNKRGEKEWVNIIKVPYIHI
jgi:hypothetical protein